MSDYAGKFIVIDGTDGSGKTTQLQLLAAKLKAEGYAVEIADFPQYNHKSAGMVEEYLSGKYGGADEVNPYASSILYATDRFDASFTIRDWLKQGKIVICNRYVSASFAHQGGKIANALERKLFFNWLSEIEYKIFNIPRPDLSLILHVEAEVAQKMAKDRAREDWKGKTKDIHEDNLAHLKKAEQVYLEIAQTMPDFRLVKCTRNGEIMSREDIHYLVWLYVSRILSIGGIKKSPDFQAVSDILITKGKITPNLPELADAPRATAVIADSPLKGIPAHPEEEQKPATPQTIFPEAKKEATNSLATIRFQRLRPEAKLPVRAHAGDAGLDLFACEDSSIPPYGHDVISTGLRVDLPAGYVGLIWDKSGLANQGYKTMGGVIDAGFRGEIKVVFKNLSEDICHIQAGQKIAQFLIQRVELPEVREDIIDIDSDRGQNGWGSTGK